MKTDKNSNGCLQTVKEYVLDESNAVFLKVAIFLYAGGAMCIFPFFVLVMRNIGLEITEIAVIYLLQPISSLIGPILSGIVADRIGRYSVVVAVNMVLAGTFFGSLLFVPQVIKPIVTFRCLEDQYYFNFTDCNSCIKNHDLFRFTVKNCSSDVPLSCTQNAEDCLPFEEVEFYGMSTEACGMYWNDFNVTREPTTCVLESSVTCVLNTFENCTEELSSEYSSTFFLVLFLMVSGNLFAGASMTMVDASILAMTKKYNIDFGRQKIPGTLAMAIFPLFSGIIVEYYSKYVGYVSYTPAFLLALIFVPLSAVIMLSLNISIPPEKENMLHNLKKLISHLEVILFLIVMLILGTNFGFIESYIFIYLQSLGGSGSLLGLTLFVGGLASVPMLFYADALQAKIGRQSIFLICFTVYAIRMFGYSLIYNPWHALLFELLEGFTYQLMWVTCLKMCPIIAPKGLLATMTGCAGAVHYSLGKGVGGFVGGHVIKAVGIRKAFRVFAGVSMFGGVFYLVIHHCYLKNKILQREKLILDDERREKQAVETITQGEQILQSELKSADQYSSVVGLPACGSQVPIGFFQLPLTNEEEKILRRRSAHCTSSQLTSSFLSVEQRRPSNSMYDISVLNNLIIDP